MSTNMHLTRRTCPCTGRGVWVFTNTWYPVVAVVHHAGTTPTPRASSPCLRALWSVWVTWPRSDARIAHNCEKGVQARDHPLGLVPGPHMGTSTAGSMSMGATACQALQRFQQTDMRGKDMTAVHARRLVMRMGSHCTRIDDTSANIRRRIEVPPGCLIRAVDQVWIHGVLADEVPRRTVLVCGKSRKQS